MKRRNDRVVKQSDRTQRPRRILILGSAVHTRLVTALEWDRLPSNLNVSDFDTVIMDFTPFADREFAQGINIETIPDWHQFARHIFSENGEVVVIGSPAFSLGGNPYRLSTWWLPLAPRFVLESGEDIRMVQPEFSSFFALVRRWAFYPEGFEEANPDFLAMYLSVGSPEADSLQPNMLAIAQTRFGRPVGFSLRFVARRSRRALTPFQQIDLAYSDIGKETVDSRESGNIIWLPAPTEASSHEVIDLILRERYGLLFETEPPNWISKFALPAEGPIEQVLKDKEMTVASLNKEIQQERKRLAQASRFRKLLYEQGEDALEPVVRDALRELGAVVEDPQQKGREDGRLTDPTGGAGMLEIKGRTGDLRLSDVRELDNWVRDAIANQNRRSKGILVVNLHCNDEPGKRSTMIPTNCLEAARNFDICMLTTTQLFRAIVDRQNGTLELQAFWSAVFASKGICSLPELV